MPAPALLAVLVALAEPAPSPEPAAGEPPRAEPATSGTSDTGTPDEAEPPPLVKGPELLELAQAPYPPEALEQGIEGTVVLEVELDELGRVVDARVIRPAGHGFDEAALEAVKRSRFAPAEDENGPVPVIFEFEYGFVLDAAEHPDAAPQPEAAPPPVNLSGVLREMGTRRPLPGVTVVLADLEGFQVQTDEQGRFAFRGVPPGPHVLAVRWPGYAPLERQVELREGEGLELTLWLRNLSYRGNELVGTYHREREEVTRYTVGVDEIRRVPGTFGDPVRVVQSLPGAARAPFGTGLLVIRGANPEDTGVYVDGIRVPLIYHLGGFVSILNADLVESVDYLPGGYGVAYGRTLGGVVDVHTRHDFPERTHLAWSTDLLDSGGLVTGRAGGGRWGYAAAARRSYIDLFLPLVLSSDYTVSPRWMDYQFKLERLDLPAGHRLGIFLFGFEDRMGLSTPKDVAQGTDPDTQGDLISRYSTHRLLLQWERPLGERLALRLAPSLGVDLNDLGLGATFEGSEDSWIGELRAELPWDLSPALTLTPGLDLTVGVYAFDVAMPFDPFSLADYDPLAEREPWSLTDRGWGWGPDAYLEARWRPLEDRERLQLVGGLRYDASALQEQFHGTALDPRLSLRFRLLEQGTLKASAGVYHQPPLVPEMYHPYAEVQTDYERARSATLGWEQEWGPALSASIEGFYKWLDQLLVPNWDLQSRTDPYFLNQGIGRIYGAELIVRRQPVDAFYGWLSYTLSRSERDDTGTGEHWYLYELDQTHIVNAVGGARLPGDLELSFRAQYVTGNPYTYYEGGVYDVDQDFYWPYRISPYDGERLPPYWAVDFRVDKLFTFRLFQLDLYLDLLHALHGVNPEQVLYAYDYSTWTYVRGIPFLPSPGFTLQGDF